MAHWSEETKKLKISVNEVEDISQLAPVCQGHPDLYLLCLPFPRSYADALNSKETFAKLADCFSGVADASTVCVLTTPADAAVILPYLEKHLKFQLWIAVKTPADAYPIEAGTIKKRHAALLVFTKGAGSLSHTKTRIQYTYCPFCKKTTKDYGGKKHTYHEYGTLVSDVWRDIECDPKENIDAVVSRLGDLFGLVEYENLRLLDARQCADLLAEEREGKQPSPSPPRAQKQVTGVESQLINDDCLKALKSLSDNSIDFCFADPPYNLKKKYDKWDDALESAEYFAWCDAWLSQLQRVLKPGRTLAVLNIPLWAARHFQHLCSIMDFQAWIAWDGLSFPVRMIMPSHYAILCFSKGNPRSLPGSVLNDADHEKEYLNPLGENYCLRAGCVSQRRRVDEIDRVAVSDLWHDVHRLKHNSRRVDHPCQLPPLLMRRLYALFTKPDEMILDCFNGAGTSTLVAEQMNRKFIGIELSSDYHRIALRRHEQIARGIDPFAKVNQVPTAKNSPVRRIVKRKYEVSKKDLQLDVRRIARDLGHLPSKEDVKTLSKFPFEYFEKYFVSWGEVCAAARTTGMTEQPSSVSEVPFGKQPNLFALADSFDVNERTK